MNFIPFIIIILALLIIAVGYCFFIFAIRRSNRKSGFSKKLIEYKDIIEAGIEWFSSQELEEIELTSHDGLKLIGHFLPADGEAKGVIILCHGYRSSLHHDFSCVYKIYHEMGYSLLSVCQRAHGLSGGKYITFGVQERHDCLLWAQYVCRRFGENCPTFISGISMGAATVLMASELPLPPNVRGITADSAYTSPYDEFRHVLRSSFHLPIHPLIDIANFFSKHIAGFSFRDASALEAVKHSRVPILFLSGEADNFVPHRFTLELYEACASEKALVTVPGAGHGMAYLVDKDKCLTAIKKFFSENSK